MERILLTGGDGFVGSYLRPLLAARWPEASLQDLGVDLMDANAVAGRLREAIPDVVIHLAAQSSVAVGLAGADTTWAVNLSGSLNLALAIAAHAPSSTLLFASTAEVYGASFLGGPVSETTPTLPLNAYAKSKLLAETMFAQVLPAATRLIVARPFNHTGPGQRETFVLPSFAAQVARIEAGLQPPRMEVGNLDVRRDFLDVRDVVEAYAALLAAAPRLPRRFTCNIASGTPRLLRDLLEMLRDLSRVQFEIVIDASRLRPIDVPSAYGEAAFLAAVTGWSPVISIEETIKDLLTTARVNTQ